MSQAFGQRVASATFLCGSALICVGGASVADAQEQTATLEEIVVTAAKREERLRDVPQSITALSGSTLSQQGVQSLADLATRVPGMVATSMGGAGQQQVTIRGVTTGLDNSPTVSTYIDDVPFGSGTPYGNAGTLGVELGSFDLQRVEVLRGPQGTLYGASAFGGLLKYVLNPPEFDYYGGQAELEGSGTENGGFNRAVRVAANISPNETFAIRANVLRNHDAGFVDNVARGDENANRSDSTVLRLAMLAKVSDALTLRASVLSQDLDRNGSADVYYNVATGQPIAGELENDQPLASPFRQKYQLYSAGADYEFDFATLSATASYQDVDFDYTNDVSELYPLVLSSITPMDAASVDYRRLLEKTTAELRLASRETEKLQWLGGIYATREDISATSTLNGYNGGEPVSVFLGTFILPATYEEISGYANATYRFSERFDTTLGVRFSHEEQSFRQIGEGLIATSNPGSDSSSDVVTWLGTSRWHFDDRNMLYVRVASGYRPGGPNLVVSDPVTGRPLGDSSYRPDKLWDYEIGAKLQPRTWLTLDASLFHIDWSDIQIGAVRNGMGVYANGEGATSRGAELAATVSANGWSVAGTLTYTDASLDEGEPDLGARAGERLPHVPRVAWNLSADRHFDIGASWDGSIGAAVRYVGERNASFDASLSSPQYRLPDYYAVDLRAGADNGPWAINLYARNILDRRDQVSANMMFAGAGGPARTSVLTPRTIGVLVSKKF